MALFLDTALNMCSYSTANANVAYIHSTISILIMHPT